MGDRREPRLRPLATALVATAPHPLAGRRVLDAGAGTGLASEPYRPRIVRLVGIV